MKSSPSVAFFGSSLVSAYWNGAATYYRGLIRALAGLGYRITFFEPDAYERQQHRDLEDPDWARVVVYAPTEGGVYDALSDARGADIVVKASGVGVFDRLLEAEVLTLRQSHNVVLFWDVDAPATLERLAADPHDEFRALVPRYDLILTYGGGPGAVEGYTALGAKGCLPVYNALDARSHHPTAPQERFRGDLGFLGNRMPDREARVDEFFVGAARRLPHRRFMLGGGGWDSRGDLPDNVRRLGHVYTRDHNAFNASNLAVLNVNRASMARFGWSPPTRVFEAAGAASCILCDAWPGIEEFLEPEVEVLVARDGAEVAAQLDRLDPERARRIGEAARRRVLAEHTYEHRARQFDQCMQQGALC